ncbi:hypothetical protein [Chromobacterium violaceum]
MTSLPKAFLVLSLAFVHFSAESAPSFYTIKTYKNGIAIDAHQVTVTELSSSSHALIDAFKDSNPSFDFLIQIANSMNAKERCINLFGARTALATIEAGIIDASKNAEETLKKSITAFEEVNSNTNVSCTMN